MIDKFSALVVKEQGDTVSYRTESITLADLSEGTVIIKTAYSSINYKDALAVKQNGGVIRSYPMIPGIDVSGEIVAAESKEYSIGQKVLVTGYGLGVSHTGGYSEYVRVPAEWIVPLPDGLTEKEAMVVGTAGFTAALAIDSLEKHGLAEKKAAPILVTGASGGVGSLAIAILTKAGYTNITALTRKAEAAAPLKKLGAAAVLLHEELIPDKIRPLGKQQFDFVLDTVGGHTLAAVLPLIGYGGSAAVCGNAGGFELSTTVLPFILRGINILGIDSVNTAMPHRLAIWKRLASEWFISDTTLTKSIGLAQAAEVFDSLQKGQHIGRTIIDFTQGAEA